MKTTILATALLCGASIAGAQQQKEPPPRMAASSFATVEVHVDARPIGREWYREDAGLTGPARIAIRYGQPHARGRAVEGGLVPLDTVWRFGANEATTLHTDLDIKLGTLSLDRGDYALYLLYTRQGWDLIVNRRTGVWGTDRDAAKDLGRVRMTARAVSEPEDALSIYLIPNSERPQSGYASLGGTLKIRWGRTELTTPFAVRGVTP
ncbi:MAG TPA: DUF2911 domain-containing protein [Gemmatimonadaceae bacterium]|nr:DUF2911 domain-containing protein [Gemmatimonadaceae bacterium]